MSRTKAINEYCKGCIYDHKAPGTWREQVENCNSGPQAKVPCPLWPYRPITVATVNANRKHRDTAGNEIDMDALLADLEDEEDEPAADPVA